MDSKKIIFVLLLFMGTIFSQELETLKNYGVYYHDLALKTMKTSYILKAKEIFEDILKRKSDDAEITVRYGSILILLALKQWFPILKIWFLYNGLEKMEEGINQNPVNPELRMIRVKTCLLVNSKYTLKIALGDLEFLYLLISEYPDRFEKENICDVLSKLIFLYNIFRESYKAKLIEEKLKDFGCKYSK